MRVGGVLPGELCKGWDGEGEGERGGRERGERGEREERRNKLVTDREGEDSRNSKREGEIREETLLIGRDERAFSMTGN